MIENKYQASAEALQKIKSGNCEYVKARTNPADISLERHVETTSYGQNPYAVILTCSDSRVPPEHIFSAGIGDLFVVRTAGNVVGRFETGSIEYAVKQLNVPLIIVMGHNHCGAIKAAFYGYDEGDIKYIADEIQLALDGAATEEEAVYNNVLHSKERILQNDVILNYCQAGKVMILCAEYDVDTGYVNFYGENQ